MNLDKKLNRIEKKAQVLNKVKENEEQIKYYRENIHDIPKLPHDVFNNAQSFFDHELTYIHPIKNYTINIENDTPHLLKASSSFEILFSVLGEVNRIYQLIMPVDVNEKNIYHFEAREGECVIHFQKEITHIKNQERIDSFMANIVPKIHRNLSNLDYSLEAITSLNLSQKKRFLSLTLKVNRPVATPTSSFTKVVR